MDTMRKLLVILLCIALSFTLPAPSVGRALSEETVAGEAAAQPEAEKEPEPAKATEAPTREPEPAKEPAKATEAPTQEPEPSEEPAKATEEPSETSGANGTAAPAEAPADDPKEAPATPAPSGEPAGDVPTPAQADLPTEMPSAEAPEAEEAQPTPEIQPTEEPMVMAAAARPDHVALNYTQVNVPVGGMVGLKASYSLNGAAFSSASEWASANSNIAAISSSGVILGRKVGTVQVAVRSKLNTSLIGICTVNVRPAPTGVSVTPSTITITEGEILSMAGHIKTTFSGGSCDYRVGDLSYVTFKSSNITIANTNQGEGYIIGMKAGTTTMTVTTCNGKKTTFTVVVKPKTVAATQVHVSPGALTVAVEASKPLTVSFGAGEWSGVTYSSDNEAVALVSATGQVTGIREGTANITVTTDEGLTDVCEVTVIPAPDKPDTAVVKYSEIDLPVGGKITLSASYLAKGEPYVSGSVWKSRNEAVATVSSTGAVTAVKAGTADIVVTCTEDESVTAVCRVHVLPAPTGVSVAPATITIEVGEKHSMAGHITTTYSGGSTQYKLGDLAYVTFKSSNIAIANTNQGEGFIIGMKPGTTTMTATTCNGMKATFTVVVTEKKEPATEIHVSPRTLEVALGRTVPLAATLGENQKSELSWRCSDEAVVSVSADGRVTGLVEGMATVTVTTDNGLEDNCQVTVVPAPDGPDTATLKYTEIDLPVGGKIQLSVSFTGKGEFCDCGSVWRSLNAPVASVSATGLVTAHKTGTADIEVACDEDSEVTAICRVHVLPAPTSVSVTPSTIAIGIGEKYSMEGRIRVNYSGGSTQYKLGDLSYVTFRSSNISIANTNQGEGYIIGMKAGTTTMTATTYNGKKATFKVVVLAAKPDTATMKYEHIDLPVGGKLTLPVSYALSGAAYSCSSTWHSENASVASVNGYGQVTGVRAGTTQIVVTCGDNSSLTAVCRVNVLPAPTGVSVSPSRVTLEVGERYFMAGHITTTYSGGTSQYKLGDMAYVTFKSSNITIANTNQGEGFIIAMKPGTVTMTVTTCNGKKATFTVVVTPKKPDGVMLKYTDVDVPVGGKLTLSASYVLDGEACPGTSQWQSRDSSIATVSASGQVTGVREGTTTVVVTCAENSDVMDLCRIHVLPAPTAVSVMPSTITIEVGERYSMAGHIITSFGDDTTTYKVGDLAYVTFKSSNIAIANTNQGEGYIVGMKPGTVTMTATTYNGSKTTFTVVVTGEMDPNAEKVDRVLIVASTLLGRPYSSSCNPPNSFDCSNYVSYCFKQIGVNVSNSAQKLGYSNYPRITSIALLKRGDICVFNTNSTDGDLSDHVGIYIGDSKFVHASSAGGKVMVSSFTNYYTRCFSWGLRVL